MQPYLITSAIPAETSRSGRLFEGVGIGDHGDGLVERADEVLAAAVIDPGLAADRGVHLRQHRGGDLHVAHAALVAGRGEARDVADDPAAERQHHRIAVEPLSDQGIENPAHRLQRLLLLPLRQDALLNAAPVAEGRAQRRQVQARHRGVGHDHEVLARDLRFDQRGVAEQSRADRDEIAGVADVYLEGLHFKDYTKLALPARAEAAR